MKTGENKTNWILPVAISLTMLCNLSLNAQQKIGEGLTGSAQLHPEEKSNIISFSPVYTDGKTYIRWMVQNDEKDGIFIVEKSSDGVQFEALGFKDRIGSPLCVNLFYSFTDDTPFQGTTWYRIMAVSTDQTYAYSSVVRVKTQPTVEPGQINSVSEE